MLSIIIPTYDRSQILQKTIDHLLFAVQGLSSEIIVVNDSRTTALDNLKQNSNLTVYSNPSQGVASARNFGAKMAKGEYFLFLDDDILVSKKNIESCMSYLQNYNNRCYLFNWLYPPELENEISRRKFGRFMITNGLTNLKGWMKNDWKENREVFKLSMGASYCLPISKENFMEVGGYNESYPHAGAEDQDFCTRVIEAGISFYLDTNETVYHNESDRVNIKNWMFRKRREGQTQKIYAKLNGVSRINYSTSKWMVLKVLSKFKFIIWALYYLIPNVTLLDPLNYLVTEKLLAIYIFDGYTSD